MLEPALANLHHYLLMVKYPPPCTPRTDAVAGILRGGGVLDEVSLIRSYVVCAPLLWVET